MLEESLTKISKRYPSLDKEFSPSFSEYYWNTMQGRNAYLENIPDELNHLLRFDLQSCQHKIKCQAHLTITHGWNRGLNLPSPSPSQNFAVSPFSHQKFTVSPFPKGFFIPPPSLSPVLVSFIFFQSSNSEYQFFYQKFVHMNPVWVSAKI